MSKIGVQLLIGENPEPFLQASVSALLPWVDYFSITGTGRADNEAAKLNRNVLEATIPAEKLRYTEFRDRVAAEDSNFFDHNLFSFSEARNLSLEQAEVGDYLIWVDADEVHYPEFEDVVTASIDDGADAINVSFYHLWMYKDRCKLVEPRRIVYKNYEGTRWVNSVHEALLHNAQKYVNVPYTYVHYGYLRPQRELFQKLNGYAVREGDLDRYVDQDPDEILTPHLESCFKFSFPHPPAARSILETYPEKP